MTERDEIERVNDDFFRALNEMFEGNIKPMEDLWSHDNDVIYMGPVPELFHIGWKVTDQDWIAQAKAHLGGAIRLVESHMTLGDEIAVVYNVAEASGQGPEKALIRMRGTNVFRKENGHWKLVAHHSDPLPYLEI